MLLKRHAVSALMTACLMAFTGCAGSAPASVEPTEETLTVITAPYANMLTGESASPAQLLADMNLKEKIGQMLMLSFRRWGENSTPVTELNESQLAAIRSHHLGGILLFDENLENTEQSVRLIDSMQNANAQGGRTSLLIAADNEGGQISRLTMGCQTCGSMALGAADSEELTQQTAALLGEEMAALGINTDLAPCLDVNNNPENPVIGVRSFSDDAQTVTKHGCAFIQGLAQQHVIAAVKHFPGHGDTDTDSHTGLPLINKNTARLEERELIPFRTAVMNDADMIMTAHIQFPQVEKDTYTSISDGSSVILPATLSDDLIDGFLRKRMGYDGVVITDALDMDAVRVHFAPMDTAKLAINAGVDMLLVPVDTSNEESLEQIWDYISGIEQMVENGDIPIERINQSVRRILTLKEKYGLLPPTHPTEEETAARIKAAKESIGSKAHHETEMEIALQTVTLVRNEGSLLPLDGSGKTVLFCPYKSELNSLEYAVEQLRADGKVPKEAEIRCVCFEDAKPEEVAEKIGDASTVVAVSALYDAEELDPISEEGGNAAYLDALLSAAKEAGVKSVLVSAQLPYDLARYPDADAALACYLAKGMKDKPDFSKPVAAYGPNLIAALYTVFGGNEPTGKLPVDVYDVNELYHYTNKLIYPRGTGLHYGQEETESAEITETDET